MKQTLLILTVSAATLLSARASIYISEVMSSEGASQTYKADWFELTNNGPTAVSITNWKIDDDSNAFATGAPLLGVSSIAPGQSVVFVEGDSTTATKFVTSWFGGAAPAGFTIGTYTIAMVSLGANGDQVNIFDDSGNAVTNVSFLTATAGTSFDNAAGLSGPITALSTVGTNGAFVSPTGETGSPGAIPEPGSTLTLLAGLGTLLVWRGRRR